MMQLQPCGKHPPMPSRWQGWPGRMVMGGGKSGEGGEGGKDSEGDEGGEGREAQGESGGQIWQGWRHLARREVRVARVAESGENGKRNLGWMARPEWRRTTATVSEVRFFLRALALENDPGDLCGPLGFQI